MNSQLSLSAITGQLSRFFARFHVILFTLFIIGGSAAAIFEINYILQQSSIIEDDPTLNTAKGFDTATIEKLEKLETNVGNGKPIRLPSNQRIDPFVE
ncbi:hypothetical protein CR983_01960 [Candidatus Saccharibacteria bacterium]|nr:MAG: hypothetical protein CR983_01960 [Candidatus Saccharibacteria bacterium]